MRTQTVDELFLPTVRRTTSVLKIEKPKSDWIDEDVFEADGTAYDTNGLVSPATSKRKRRSGPIKVRAKSVRSSRSLKSFARMPTKSQNRPRLSRNSVKPTRKGSIMSIRSLGAISTTSTSSSISTRFERFAAQVDKLPWSKQKKGETLEQLYNTDFFTSRANPQDQKRKLTRLPVLALSTPREMSLRPFSMLKTPTTFYDNDSLDVCISPSVRPFSFAVRRHTSRALPTLLEDCTLEEADEDFSPLVKEATDLGDVSYFGRKSSDQQGRRSTLLRLSSGSLLTLIASDYDASDLDAWKRSHYIHGEVRLQNPSYLAQRLSLVGLALWEEDGDAVVEVRSINDSMINSTLDFFDPMISQPESLRSASESEGESPYLSAPLLDRALAEAIANMRIGSHIRKISCAV